MTVLIGITAWVGRPVQARRLPFCGLEFDHGERNWRLGPRGPSQLEGCRTAGRGERKALVRSARGVVRGRVISVLRF